jgi:undecaprenyldiphospho-muramoylpentapeptide beta-N-acetylglucosaminyltransferase
MTNYLLAGGGTAGHINPMLSLADYIRKVEPNSNVYCVGTKSGLETTLVPKAGYKLLKIPKTPLTRSISPKNLILVFKLIWAIIKVGHYIRSYKIDKIIGFGGYVSIPVYLYCRITGRKYTINEQNAKPGLANRIGAKWAKSVTTVFSNSSLLNAVQVGLPLRASIVELANAPGSRIGEIRNEVFAKYGFDPKLPLVFITGGSSGAENLNINFSNNIDLFLDNNIQVLLQAGKNKLVENSKIIQTEYVDEMEKHLVAVDLVVSRSGAGMVNEIAALKKPSVLIPLDYGNGEQELNSKLIIDAGGGVLIKNSELGREQIEEKIIPLVSNTKNLEQMSKNLESVAIVDADKRLFEILLN